MMMMTIVELMILIDCIIGTWSISPPPCTASTADDDGLTFVSRVLNRYQ